MKEKTELLTNFILFFIPTVEMLLKEIQSLHNFSFLKIVKIESTNKVHNSFLFFGKLFEEVFCVARTALK
jgi:hypothetical protein